MTRDELVQTLASFPDRFAAAASVAGPTPPGEWGPAEIARHLIAVEDEVWRARLAAVAAEDEPHWTRTEPGLASGFEDAPPDAIVAAFADARAGTVKVVRALDDAGWQRAGIHATHGRLDVAGLLRVAIDHDEEHLAGLG